MAGRPKKNASGRGGKTGAKREADLAADLEVERERLELNGLSDAIAGAPAMRRRWGAMLEHWGIPRELADTTFPQICEFYRIPPRVYHTLGHIEDCLTAFDDLRPECDNPVAVEASIWFHDSIYITQHTDNEQRSAGLAREYLGLLGRPKDFRERVYGLVLATTHDRPPRDRDEAAILDADLAGLGGPPDEFDRHGEAIREEYSWVLEDEYRAGRAEILRKFLDRPRIYYTELFHERFETRARENLARAIQALTRPL